MAGRRVVVVMYRTCGTVVRLKSQKVRQLPGSRSVANKCPVPQIRSHKLARWIQGREDNTTKPLGRNELRPGVSAMANCQKDRQMQGHELLQ